jgi:hypothetical protein
MKFPESFILGIPYLFLKKIPYAWLAAVIFWSRPPVLSGALLAVVALGLLAMLWQRKAWEAKITREQNRSGAGPYIDRPHAPRLYQLRNLALLFLTSGLLAWLLNGRLALSGWQWFFLLTGFMLLYKDTLLLGATVTYILTDQGVGIHFIPGHVDYRLFFKYHEIRQAARKRLPRPHPPHWELITPVRFPQEGVLLSAKNRNGFSQQLQGELFLAPTDIEVFLEHISRRVFIPREPLEAPAS